MARPNSEDFCCLSSWRSNSLSLKIPRCCVYVWAHPREDLSRTLSGIIFLFISSKYGLHLGSVFEPYFGASTFNNHVLPTWLPVFPVAVTCHQKRTDHYVLGCHVTREMPKVLESCLVLFGTMFGSRPGPTQDCWAAGLHCNRTAAQCGCCAAGLLGHRVVSAGAARCKAAAQQGKGLWRE